MPRKVVTIAACQRRGIFLHFALFIDSPLPKYARLCVCTMCESHASTVRGDDDATRTDGASIERKKYNFVMENAYLYLA